MKYKYYIYQQSVTALTEDKYDIDMNYNFIGEVRPTGNWSLAYEHDEEWLHVWRWKFTGTLNLSGDDYSLIMSSLNECLQLAIRIYQLCDGIYVNLWEGLFSKYEFEVDEDRCNLSIKPETLDIYTRFFNVYTNKYNFFDVPNIIDARMEIYGFPVEYAIASPDFYMAYPVAIIPPIWHEYLFPPGGYIAGNEYYLYQMRIKKEPRYNIAGQLLSNFRVNRTYAREWTINQSAITPPAGLYWTMVEQIDDTNYKWARRVGAEAWTTYDFVDNGDIQTYTLHGYSTAIGTSSFTFQNARYITDIFEYLLEPVGIGFTSLLLGVVNPMGGTSLQKLTLASTYEFGDYSNPATNQDITLKGLLLSLKELLNIQFYIDTNRTLHLENERYFSLGYSYTVPKTVTLDLTLPAYVQYAKGLNKYTYGSQTKYLYEDWEIPFSDGQDFVGEQITYKCSADAETKLHPTEFGTDLWWMAVHSSELPRNGWALIQVYDTGGGISIRAVRNEVGILSGGVIPNGHLSLANLHNRYWTWERLFPTGKMNGNDISFDSFEFKRIQTALNVPACCDIDMTGLIRTGLGEGLLESAEYESKSGMMKIIVKHE